MPTAHTIPSWTHFLVSTCYSLHMKCFLQAHIFQPLVPVILSWETLGGGPRLVEGSPWGHPFPGPFLSCSLLVIQFEELSATLSHFHDALLKCMVLSEHGLNPLKP